MNRDPNAWTRLGQALRHARLARGLSQGEVAAQARVSTASVQAAEAGVVPKRRMPITLAPIATALGWPPGSVEAVLEGGRPPGVEGIDVSVQKYIDEEMLGDVMTSAMVRATDSVTTAEIKAAVKIAVDELRRRGAIPETNGVQP
ncbi:helix-turn-helix transcriptional regulator [Streptomyces sp. NPDC052644]